MKISEDPIYNAIQDGIKKGIRITFDAECFGSCVILIYSAIDAMAFIALPEDREDVHRGDFIAWSEKYLLGVDFPLTGLELYAARCGMLHNYGIDSKLFRENKVRRLGYADQAESPVVYDSGIDPTFAIVSISALMESLFNGIDRFLIDLFKDHSKAMTAEQRLKKLVLKTPLHGDK